jgi:hypothetical protein
LKFINFDFEVLKRVQSSLLLHAKNPSNLLKLRQTACIESFLLFAGPLLFDEKIHHSAAQAVFRARLGDKADTKPPSKT